MINANRCHDPKTLESIFSAGKRVSVAHLMGRDSLTHWRVKMLTGPIPNMGGPVWRHRKVFARIGPGELGLIG